MNPEVIKCRMGHFLLRRYYWRLLLTWVWPARMDKIPERRGQSLGLALPSTRPGLGGVGAVIAVGGSLLRDLIRSLVRRCVCPRLRVRV